jgi:ABC-type Fe3+-hydroxamate transport system substrate-binding protein
MPRVVSLVPSVTETLVALGVAPVACTRFCEQPGIATVGGTKDPHVAAIIALRPDLVVVNDEENRREDADALTAAGLHLHSMSPRSVADVGPAVVDLARAVGVALPDPFAEWTAWQSACARPVASRQRRVAVLVWRRPWMTLASDTYAASLLEMLGFDNALAAGAGPAGTAARYPETSLDELAAAAPDVVLLPSEPYPFGERHVPEVAAAMAPAGVELVDGRDLFWWGIRTPDAYARLAESLTPT